MDNRNPVAESVFTQHLKSRGFFYKGAWVWILCLHVGMNLRAQSQSRYNTN